MRLWIIAFTQLLLVFGHYKDWLDWPLLFPLLLTFPSRLWQSKRAQSLGSPQSWNIMLLVPHIVPKCIQPSIQSTGATTIWLPFEESVKSLSNHISGSMRVEMCSAGLWHPSYGISTSWVMGVKKGEAPSLPVPDGLLCVCWSGSRRRQQPKSNGERDSRVDWPTSSELPSRAGRQSRFPVQNVSPRLSLIDILTNAENYSKEICLYIWRLDVCQEGNDFFYICVRR